MSIKTTDNTLSKECFKNYLNERFETLPENIEVPYNNTTKEFNFISKWNRKELSNVQPIIS